MFLVVLFWRKEIFLKIRQKKAIDINGYSFRIYAFITVNSI
jgi:hypothetical protein